MNPTIKANGNNTYHRDGSVSYWSVCRQQWVRETADKIANRELAAMRESERQRVEAVMVAQRGAGAAA